MTDEVRAEGARGLESLPAPLRERLTEWSARLAATLGDDLVGIVVHGSVARGEYRPGESDVDAVVVVRRPTFARLEAIGDAMQFARYAARIEAMILTEEEIAEASDAFPLLYGEIEQCHVVVSGRDPFASLSIHDAHRRLRIEQELREAQIRMRRAVTDALGAREAVGGAVSRRVKQIRGALRALLALKGISTGMDLAAVLGRAGEVYGVDVTPLWDARAAPDAAHAAFVALLDAAIHDVNAMHDGTAPSSTAAVRPREAG